MVFSTIEVESLNVDSCDFRCVIFAVKPSLIAFDGKKINGSSYKLNKHACYLFLNIILGRFLKMVNENLNQTRPKIYFGAQIRILLSSDFTNFCSARYCFLLIKRNFKVEKTLTFFTNHWPWRKILKSTAILSDHLNSNDLKIFSRKPVGRRISISEKCLLLCHMNKLGVHFCEMVYHCALVEVSSSI